MGDTFGNERGLFLEQSHEHLHLDRTPKNENTFIVLFPFYRAYIVLERGDTVEQWKQIEIDNVIYEDYEISSHGRVRNINYRNTGRIRVLKPHLDTRNYYDIGIWKNGMKKTYRVHTLVATMFIPNPHGLTEVDHIDRNRHNNHVSNLRWTTHQQNMDNGGKRVRCIETGQIFDTINQASREMGIDSSNLSKHLRGIGYKTLKGLHFEYVEE